MRKKKWAIPELKACSYFVENPDKNLCQLFKRPNPIHLEIGCGKGVFTSEIALRNKNVNYIGIDLSTDVLGVCRRNIEKKYSLAGEKIDNILIMCYNAGNLMDVFKENSVDRIYLNFSNPWSKKKHHKRRLTYPSMLKIYEKILKPNSKIFFKTDDENLFEDSIGYFNSTNFKIDKLTYDLHSENLNDESSILTEHELMFLKENKKIKFLSANLIK